jgi:hypothetical protein
MRGVVAIAALAIVAGCASARPQPARLAGAETCNYVVRNATSTALEVRRFGERSLEGIGTLNPIEQLSESTPCSDGRVYVLGIPVPIQVGAPRGRPVFGFVDLEPGKNAQLTLYWP